MKVNVIGAGIIGAALAWRLTKAGADVTLIDPHPPGGVASAASFGWINAAHGNPRNYFDLRMASMTAWHRLKKQDATVPFHPDGTLYMHYDTDHDRHFAEHSAWGYDLRWMERDEIAKAEPNLANPPERCLYAPYEGQLHVDAAARYFAEQLIAAGGVVVRQHVQNLDTGAADHTVLAAGTASVDLARTIGVSVPLTSPPGLLVYSKPIKSRIIFHTLLSEGLHIQQRPDGRLVAGADFGGGSINDDVQAGAAEIFTRMARSLPNAALEYDTYSLGLRPTPIDGLPIIGQPRDAPGLYVAVMHSGATLAPVVAELAAQEIMTGHRDTLLEPFGPDRF